MSYLIIKNKLLNMFFLALIMLDFSTSAFAVDAEAALSLARQNTCLLCHAIDYRKVGPAYRDVAAKFKSINHADAVRALIEHITSGNKVTFPDGHQENHRIIKTNDIAQQTNLVEWILSLPNGQWPESH